jgi:hypothetical protein
MSVSVRAARLGLVCLLGIGLAGLAPGCGPGLEPPGENDSAGSPREDAGVPSASAGRGGTGAATVAGTGAAAAAGTNAGAAGVSGAAADDAGVEDDAGR